MQIHFILGLGYFGSEASNNPLIRGEMADIAASPNDPIFLNHHAMVDCIFETWLQKNRSNAQYPISSEIPKGHRRDDYIVPFFPLYKHADMFHTADKFGYKCKIEPLAAPNTKGGLTSEEIAGIVIAVLVIVAIIIMAIIVLWVCYKCGYLHCCCHQPIYDRC